MAISVSLPTPAAHAHRICANLGSLGIQLIFVVVIISLVLIRESTPPFPASRRPHLPSERPYVHDAMRYLYYRDEMHT